MLSNNTCIQYTFVALATQDTKAVLSDRVIIRRLRHASILLCYIVQRHDRHVTNVNNYILQEKMRPFLALRSNKACKTSAHGGIYLCCSPGI